MYGWARDASDELAGRGRVREWKALVWGWLLLQPTLIRVQKNGGVVF
jgi:hypothetical protein